MEIVGIAAFAIISTCLLMAIKEHRPEIALLLSIGAGIAILTVCVPKIQEILAKINEISQVASINAGTIGILLKVVGIVYITEFASGVCKDAKEEGLAQKVQIAGKVIIVSMAIPLALDILKIITEILK